MWRPSGGGSAQPAAHLHRLHHAERLARRQRGAHRRQLHVHDVTQLALRTAQHRSRSEKGLRGTQPRPRATRCKARATRAHAARCVCARIGAVRRVRRVERGVGATTCLSVVRDANGANITLDLHPLRAAATARVRTAARAPGGGCARLVALGILEVVHHCKHALARQSVRRAVNTRSRPRGAAQSSAPFEKLRTATGATLSEGHAEPALRRRPLATWRSIVQREEGGMLRCHVSVHNNIVERRTTMQFSIEVTLMMINVAGPTAAGCGGASLHLRFFVLRFESSLAPPPALL